MKDIRMFLVIGLVVSAIGCYGEKAVATASSVGTRFMTQWHDVAANSQAYGRGAAYADRKAAIARERIGL